MAEPTEADIVQELFRRRSSLTPEQGKMVDQLMRQMVASGEIRGATPTAPAPSEPPRTAEDATFDFLKSAWGKINPVTQFTSAATAVNQPLTAGKAILGAQGDLAIKAKESFQRGDYATAARQALHYMIPLFGPEFEQAGEKVAQGKYAEGFGETTGIGLNIVAPTVIGKVKAAIPLPALLTNPNPKVAGALQFLENRGVPIPAGAATGNAFVGGAQKLSAYTPLGGVVAQRAERQGAQALERTAGDLAQQAHPTPVVPEQAGTSLRGALERKKAGHQQIAGQNYAIPEALEADPAFTRNVQVRMEKSPTGQMTPVMADVPLPYDVRGLKTELRPIYEKMSGWTDLEQNSSRGYKAVKIIMEGPDHIPLSAAERALGGLKELGREGKGRNAGLAKHIVPKLQAGIDNTLAQADPAALNAMRTARTETARAFTTDAVLKTLREEPVEAFGQTIHANDASIGLLRKIERQTPGELPKIGRAFLAKLQKTATAEGGFGRAPGLWAEWQNLGPETRKLLFKDPLLIENLDKFFLGAKKLAENPNPSGSAFMGAVAAQLPWLVHNPIEGTWYTLGTGAMAKMLYSPKGVNLLTQGMKLRLGGDRARAAAVAAQILQMAGKDVQRLDPAMAQ